MTRIFSAVDVDEKEILNRLVEIRDTLDLEFKTVPEHKMHITLQFFRDIDEKEIEEVKKAMEKTSLEPFKVELKKIGVFPSRDYIRVVWAGAKADELHKLYSQVSEHSISPDNNYDFRPHITLMRVENISQEHKKKLRRMIREYENEFFGELKVNTVKLFESNLTPQGSKYELLEEKQL